MPGAAGTATAAAAATLQGAISATIKIRKNTYTLVAEGSVFSTATPGGVTGSSGSSGTPSISAPRIRLHYKANWSDAIDLGTLDDAAAAGSDLITDIGTALNIKLADNWSSIKSQLTALPQPFTKVFNDILTGVSLRITQIDLELTPDATDSTKYKSGSVALGFGFDCSKVPDSDRKLFGIVLESVGINIAATAISLP